MEKQAVVKPGVTPDLEDDLRPEYDLKELKRVPLEKSARDQRQVTSLAMQDPLTRLSEDASK